MYPEYTDALKLDNRPSAPTGVRPLATARSVSASSG